MILKLKKIGENMKTSIVILTYNNLEYTKQCIESIRKYTDKGTYEIIVVDNASSDETVQWLNEQDDIKKILNSKNQGFPKGCNQGIEVSTGDNVLLLNNDVIVTPNWLKNLTTALYSGEQIGAVGAITNSCSNNQAIQVNYKDYDELIAFAKRVNVSDPIRWKERIRLIGFCMLIKRNVVDKIGLLDERFTPGNFEDDDYSYRIRQAGYKLLLCKDSFIHHYGSTSFSKDIEKYNKLLNTNKQKFKDKWGFDPIYSSAVRYDILKLIDEKEDSNIRVLEVGCACGGTLLEIKNRYKKSEIYGIELNEKAANIAKFVADVKTENIENEKLSYEEKYFDYIIFGDVLEHLYDPYKVIKNMKKYLKDDGKILSSIPNIMHYSVIRQLLNGRWTYEDAGILDRTHIRFFTLNEINNMFIKAGFEIKKVAVNRIQKSQSDKEFLNVLINISNREVSNQFDAYQYVIKAVKKGQLDIENMKIIKLKYALRRIENDVQLDQSKSEILEMIKNNTINYESIIKVVVNDIIKKDTLLNEVAILCYENRIYDQVLPLLQKAYEIDENNINTIYNLAYVLYKFGQNKLALKYLFKFEEKDRDIKELADDIRSEIND